MQGKAHSRIMEILYESPVVGNQGLEVLGTEELFTVQNLIFFLG